MDENRIVFKEGLIGFESDGTPYLIASRCRNCGKVFFPQRELCPECFSEDLEQIALKEAELQVFTVVHIGVKGFDTPYILAWVKFPEGPRIVAQIDHPADQAGALHIGQKLKVGYGPLRTREDGVQLMGYRFIPVF